MLDQLFDEIFEDEAGGGDALAVIGDIRGGGGRRQRKQHGEGRGER